MERGGASGAAFPRCRFRAPPARFRHPREPGAHPRASRAPPRSRLCAPGTVPTAVPSPARRPAAGVQPAHRIGRLVAPALPRSPRDVRPIHTLPAPVGMGAPPTAVTASGAGRPDRLRDDDVVDGDLGRQPEDAVGDPDLGGNEARGRRPFLGPELRPGGAGSIRHDVGGDRNVRGRGPVWGREPVQAGVWSGRRDSNPRSRAPKARALASYATPRRASGDMIWRSQPGAPLAGQKPSRASFGARRRAARPRWEIRCFSSGAYSPKVRPPGGSPAGSKIGS